MELLFGLFFLALDIWAIVNIVNSDATGLARLLWVLGVVIFPLLGFLIWLVAGPRRQRQYVA